MNANYNKNNLQINNNNINDNLKLSTNNLNNKSINNSEKVHSSIFSNIKTSKDMKDFNDYYNYLRKNENKSDSSSSGHRPKNFKISLSQPKTNNLYLCKKCYNFPELKFINKEKIIIICKKHNYSKEIKITEAPQELVYEYSDNKRKFNLLCKEHNQKFVYYCLICNKHICQKCYEECKKKEHKINKLIKQKESKIIKKIEEEIEQIEKNKYSIEMSNYKDNFINDNSFCDKINQNDNNINSSNFSSQLLKTEVIDKSEESNDINFFRLFKIVFSNYKYYPNNIHEININNINDFFNNFYGNEITLKYKIIDEKKIKLFGTKFIENNKDICYFIINNEEKELEEYYSLDENKKPKELGVKLVKKKGKQFKNMSYIFHECTCLISLDNISKWDISNVDNMSHGFHGCSSLSKIPENISLWDTSKVEDMSYLFYFCSSLNEIPNSITQWNFSKVKTMDYMFYGCGINKMPTIDTS